MPKRNTSTSDYAEQLRKKTCACRLHHQKMGVRKSLTREQRTAAADVFQADGSVISATKKLIDTRDPAYREVVKIRGRATDFWKSMSVPFPEPGIRLIRRDRIELFEEQMTAFREQLMQAVQQLQGKYDELKSRAQQELGSLFNPHDYPESIVNEFNLGWDFPSVEPPGYLKDLHPDLYERECKRIQAHFEESVKLTEEAFLHTLHELIGHLVERLKGDVDGKPKVFRDSAVENLNAFFEQFRQLDIGSSEEIAQLVKNAQKAVKGVTPDDLRANKTVRETVASKLGEIGSTLDELMVNKPKRKITFAPGKTTPKSESESNAESAEDKAA